MVISVHLPIDENEEEIRCPYCDHCRTERIRGFFETRAL